MKKRNEKDEETKEEKLTSGKDNEKGKITSKKRKGNKRLKKNMKKK